MFKRIGRLGIVILLIIIPLTAIIWLALVESEVGMAKDIGIQGPASLSYDPSSVPPSVLDDAKKKASELVGKNKEKLQGVVDQLVATYMEAKNVDIVVFFNSGGWGWNSPQDTPGWTSIIEGITSQLTNLGYRSLVLNYQRTSRGLRGCIKEFFEAATRYPSKAQDLSQRVEFLTDHLPGLKIIIAGESTGTVISARTMDILRDKPQVYSIQTGTPFWYQPEKTDRTLLMNSNGRGIDTFSYGNVPAMVWATFKGWFGLSSPNDNPGNILSWLKAPGHHYSWQYPGVSSAVIGFLENDLGKKD